jgi:diguanylate cyclase (GGDEF)-like protein
MHVVVRDDADSGWRDEDDGLASRLLRYPRRISYPLLGVGLALGAPLGLLVLRAIRFGWPPTIGWFAYDLVRQALTYGYLVVSTTLVFVLVGWRVGRSADRLGALSTTDAMTGLPNLRQFRSRAGEEVLRSHRAGAPLSLLLVDIDGLKEINDVGGHAAGDRAIQAVARGLVGACRASDFPARIGGDEFAVLAPSTRAADAVELADRVRQAVRDASDPATVRVSVGIADLEIAGTLRVEALLRVADRALYRAKHEGRDRASLPPPPPSSSSRHA